ncbi:HlyD family efflux transporter periplasmic adaptor subunit [Ketogulonicigenium vulgare]|uniref:HlyD family efflux transporter periplasmic adaptor subunit n=1 Tax=Ketogulonicigenium vulgare TaxID=92945 RepID=UPI002359A8BA|nr:HlyD family efflux transporter periplasmic adaptor subunit [Ketogulonicigenium vulgare]
MRGGQDTLAGLMRSLWHLGAALLVILGGLGALLPIPTATVARGTMTAPMAAIPLMTIEGGQVADSFGAIDQAVFADQRLLGLDDRALRMQRDALLAEAALLQTRRLALQDPALADAIAADRAASLAVLAQEETGLSARLSLLENRLPRAQRQAEAQAQLATSGAIPAAAALAAQEDLGALQDSHAALTAGLAAIPERRAALFSQAAMRIEELASQTATQISAIDARLVAITAEENTLDLRIAQYQITAPVAGRLLTYTASPGQILRPGEVFASLLPDGTPQQATLPIAPEQATHLHIGQPARLTAIGFQQAEISAHISAISAEPLLDDQGRAYLRVSLRLDHPADLRPGQPVEVRFTGPARPLLAALADPLTRALHTALREPPLPAVAAPAQSD